jgi:integrase
VNTLRTAAEDYLVMRRSLGYKLETQGHLLLDFVGYLERTGAATVTVAAAVAWAAQPAGAAPVWWARRLSVARCFARHLATLDPACEVPPTDLLPARYRRRTPYLYSPAEVAALVHAAGTLAVPLHAATYQALVSLLAATGLRVGEAMALGRRDVDLDTGLLTVERGKHDRSRRVPLHPTTTEMLRRYTRRRDRLCPAPAADSFFVSTAGTRLLAANVDQVFTRLLSLAAVPTPPGGQRPHIHDLRHSFAVATLQDWYRDGGDVAARLPLLSTYLGHTNPAHTYWYLHAAPELMAIAARRLETSQGLLP